MGDTLTTVGATGMITTLYVVLKSRRGSIDVVSVHRTEEGAEESLGTQRDLVEKYSTDPQEHSYWIQSQDLQD